MAYKITKHNIRTDMTSVVKGDVIKTNFQMEIETLDCLDNTTIASLIVAYIKEQLKNHLKMEATKDLKGYRKAIRRMLKEIKKDEEHWGFSDLSSGLYIQSDTQEVSEEYYKDKQLKPFHKDNIFRPLTWKEYNRSESNRLKEIMKELEELNV